MAWYEIPCEFGLTKDGQYYQGVGTEDNPVEIQAIEIIEALDDIATRNDVKGIRICYGRVDGGLDIRDAENLERVKEDDGTYYIKLPNVEFSFRGTAFDGNVYLIYTQLGDFIDFRGNQFKRGVSFAGSRFGAALFSNATFEEKTSFGDAQFRGIADFSGSQFGGETDFTDARFEHEANFGSVHFEHIYFGGAMFLGEKHQRTLFIDAKFWKNATFDRAKFKERPIFSGIQFGQSVSFTGAQFESPAGFTGIKYWSDSPKVTIARWLWKDKLLFSIGLDVSGSLHQIFKDNGISLSNRVLIKEIGRGWLITDVMKEQEYSIREEKEKLKVYVDGIRNKAIKRFLLPKYSPEGKPPKFIELYPGKRSKFNGTQFYLDSQHIDEVSNPHFKRYVADQQYIRAFQKNHFVIHWFWRWSSDCGRSIGLWAFWSSLIMLLFSCAYNLYCLFWVLGIIFLVIGIISLVVGGFFIWRDLVSNIIKYLKGRLSSCELVGIMRNKWLRCLLVYLHCYGIWLLMFLVMGAIAYMPRMQPLKFDEFINNLYFSVVVFTTLGFSKTLGIAEKMLIMTEVILGYIMLGVLIGIALEKIARRS